MRSMLHVKPIDSGSPSKDFIMPYLGYCLRLSRTTMTQKSRFVHPNHSLSYSTTIDTRNLQAQTTTRPWQCKYAKHYPTAVPHSLPSLPFPVVYIKRLRDYYRRPAIQNSLKSKSLLLSESYSSVSRQSIAAIGRPKNTSAGATAIVYTSSVATYGKEERDLFLDLSSHSNLCFKEYL